MRPTFLTVLVLILAATGSLLRAQSIRWQPASGTLALGQTTELSLIFDECEPTGEITLPALGGVTIGRPSRGEQSSFNVVNGKAARTRTIYFTYPVRPALKATVSIPEFEVATDRGPIKVPAASFQVVDATVGGGTVPLDAAANSTLTVGSGTAWAGEVLPVSYSLSISNRFPAQLASNPDWSASPLVIEEWAKPEPFTAMVAGESRNNIVYQTRGYIKAPGNYTLNAVNQLVNLRVPSANFSVFQAFQAEQFSITSNRPALTVRPLPQPAPAGFEGAVGEFTLVSKVVPENAGVSEPITWTLELQGKGNWPDIAGLPAREASRDFRVVQPEARRTNKEGALFESALSEDVVLIPTKPGTYTLGPVVWTYFDPASGTYKTISTERVTVTVTAPATAPSSFVAPSVTVPGTAPEVPTAPPQPPGEPEAIPRDPIPGSSQASVPWTDGGTWLALAASVAWLPVFWLALAWRRARQTDPVRSRREARARLASTLSALRTAREPAQIAGLLLRWQHETALLWPLAKAAPAASAFLPDQAWSTLWNESERTLYGAGQPLPADWVTRAEAALAAKTVPGFDAGSIFLRRNLLPFLAGLALLLVLTPPGRAADDAAATAYGRSEFSVAEKLWREAVRKEPVDWIAHHNLALALGQQNRWGEAAAHAVAAFVQSPADPAVQWQLGLTLQRAGYAPLEVAPFMQPGGRHALARRLSPAGWQKAIALSGLIAAAAIALVLLRGYGLRSRLVLPAAGILLLVAIVGASTALVSLSTYGTLRDARTVIVWHQATLRSIPTEADTAQTTTNLGAGSIAVIDKTFLGWLRLAFANGQTGWVRQEDVVRLYR